MTQLPLRINDISILPGERTVVKIPVGRLPSGNQINIRAHIFRSNIPGPTVLLLGGIHGDEINGVEIVRRAINDNLFDQLERGSVIAIPLLNVYGFINFSREVTDGKDVNRSFPGSLRGSLASRIARIVTKKILPHIDFGIDFHTGGNSLYNYPQIRYSKSDPNSLNLAQAFGAPFIVASAAIRKSFRKSALSEGKTILVYEGGETLRYDGLSIAKALAGIRRFLYTQAMLPTKPADEQAIVFQKSSWMRAPQAGMFQWYKKSGRAVQKGEPVGVINDPFGMETRTLYASRTGYIIGHNNAPVVHQGDALFHIGYEQME
jgi:hypothetical protein